MGLAGTRSLTSVGDLSLAHEVRLVGDQNDGGRRVFVAALKARQHVGDVVVRLAVGDRVQQNEPVHVAVVLLVVL